LGGAQDRLVVTTPDGSEVEVPFVATLVPEITPGSITIDPPPGLFPESP
jgi:16S rRNA processing protein RimM